MISPSHLRTHNISGAEYKLKFPGSTLRVQTAASKEKIARAKLGKCAWNKGKKTGPNYKLSESIRGKPRQGARGKRRTEEQKVKISEQTRLAMRRAMTDAVKQKLRAAIGERKAAGRYVAPMQGKKLSSAARNKISHSLMRVNQEKSEEKIRKLIGVAAKENIIVESVKNGYWFNLYCQNCNNKFTFSRQIFRASVKGGKEICPSCYPRNSGRSEVERELFEFIKELDSGAIANDRTLLGGKELDIYIPEKKLAFEFTGLYWHAEKQNPENKHLLWKMQFALNHGIRLITIFEDEWVKKRPIVESRIRSILGFVDKTVYARECDIRPVTPKVKNDFLVDNHIQGRDISSIALGLFHADALVALATFKKTNMSKGGKGTAWELSRFCSSKNTRVIGGASKLIKHFMKHANSEKLQLISYADRRWSTGQLYKTIGFKFAGTSSPSYWYTRDYKTRVHRAALMKHTLVQGPEDLVHTEWALAQRAGFDRIWDCGTTKWVLNP